MVSNGLITIPAFLTLSISLQFLFLSILLNFIIMHGDKPNINLNILIQNEGFGVQIPPISTLIFDKIANQLVKGDFQMVLYKFTNVNN